MTADDETSGDKPGKGSQLPSNTPALPPGRMVRVGVRELPKLFAPQPFTDEQAQYVREAAGLTVFESDSPEYLSRVAFEFVFDSYNRLTLRDCHTQWSEAREKASKLLLAIKPLTDDENLHLELQNFCDEAKRVTEILDKDLKFRRQRKSRDRPKTTKILGADLTIEFQRLFNQSPTASPQGSYHKFLDAFIEIMKDNTPSVVNVKFPKGANLCRLLNRK